MDGGFLSGITVTKCHKLVGLTHQKCILLEDRGLGVHSQGVNKAMLPLSLYTDPSLVSSWLLAEAGHPGISLAMAASLPSRPPLLHGAPFFYQDTSHIGIRAH